eukprot:gene5440-7156_t
MDKGKGNVVSEREMCKSKGVADHSPKPKRSSDAMMIASAVNALHTMHIADIPSSFIAEAWDCALVDVSKIDEIWPFDDNSAQIVDACCKLKSSLDYWLTCQNSNEHSCSIRALLTVVAYHMDGEIRTKLCFVGLYLRLLQLPGATSHKIFQPMLFRSACNVVSNTFLLVDGGDGPCEEFVDMQKTEITEHKKVAAKLLRDLVAITSSIDLRLMADTLDVLIDTLINATREDKYNLEMTRQELEYPSEHLPIPTIGYAIYMVVVGTSTEACGKVYGICTCPGLFHICTRGHDNGYFRMVLKGLLQTLNMSWISSLNSRSSTLSGNNFTKKHLNIRDTALKFLHHVRNTLGETSLTLFRVLAQHLCSSIPDRTPARTQGAEAFVQIIQMMTADHAVQLLQWLRVFSRSNKISHRTTSLEYICSVLMEGAWWKSLEKQQELHLDDSPQKCNDETTPTRNSFSTPTSPQTNLKGKAPSMSTLKRKLVGVIFLRCSDKAVAVRTKALKCLAALGNAATKSDMKWLHDLILSTYLQLSTQGFQEFVASTTQTMHVEDSDTSCSFSPTRLKRSDSSITSKDTIQKMLSRRLTDPKSGVRRAAILALESILRIEDVVSVDEVAALSGRCRDPSLSVRKQALDSCFLVISTHYHSDLVRREIFQATLPLMSDNEDSVRLKCTDLIYGLVFDGILLEPTHDLCNSFIIWLADHSDYRRYLLHGCTNWKTNNRIESSHVQALLKKIDSGLTAAWSLLLILANQFKELFEPDIVFKYWNASILDDVIVSSAIVSILNTIGEQLSTKQRRTLIEQLKTRICSFELQPTLIAVALTTIIKFEALNEQTKDGLASGSISFCRELLKKCKEAIIHSPSLIEDSRNEDGNIDINIFTRSIFTLGETAMLCAQSVDDDLVLPLQNLIVHEDSYGSVIRAHAYLALGKVCLQQEELAKTWISSMARELEECSDAAVRNNIVVVLADLCIRYTNLVERYISTLAFCLRDPSPLVRRQSLMLLTRLMTEDYIKLKGALFFRLLVTLVDEDIHVRNLSYYCLVHMLYSRDSTLFRAHFVESIFYLNNFTGHHSYNCIPQSDKDRARFNFSGISNRSKREYMYRIMLQHCTDVDRLNITQDLCEGILSVVADEDIPLKDGMEDVLADALVILSSKDIKLGRSMDAQDEEESGLKEAMRAQIISKISKKNLVQNIMPIVIQLKNFLDLSQSPLQKNIMIYLREVTHDHRDDVEELLSGNEQLAREIKFDLERFNKENEKRRASVMSLAATPSRMSPHLRSHSVIPSPFIPTVNTPNFRAPVLRVQSSKHTKSSTYRSARTPLRRETTVPMTTTPGVVVDRDFRNETERMVPQSPVGSLAWVRTPHSKSSSLHKGWFIVLESSVKFAIMVITAAPGKLSQKVVKNLSPIRTDKTITGSSSETDIIVLESPFEERGNRSIVKWRIPPPSFHSPSKSMSSTGDKQSCCGSDDYDPILEEVPETKRAKSFTDSSN